MLNQIKDLRNRYISLPSTSEETVKLQIVVPMMEILGFRVEWIEGERPVKSRRNIVDLCYHIPDYESKLFVEVKAPNVALKDKEIEQISNYQNISNLTWGILTNGREYILMNHKIDGEADQKKIAYCDINNEEDVNKLKVMSYKSIFISKESQYEYYLKQFKIYFEKKYGKNEKSWLQYRTTIKNFSKYLLDNNYGLEYEDIRLADFKNFIRMQKQQYGINYSYNGIISKFRYLNSMLILLSENKVIRKNQLRNIDSATIVSGLEYSKTKEFMVLSEDVFMKLYDVALSSQNAERNSLLLKLISTIPLTRMDLWNIKVNDYNFEEETLQLAERVVHLPSKLMDEFRTYFTKRQLEGDNCEYFLSKYYGNEFIHIQEDSISALITNLKNKTDLDKGVLKSINLQTIRGSVIHLLVHGEKATVTEVMKLANCDISTIKTYCNLNELAEKAELSDLVLESKYYKP